MNTIQDTFSNGYKAHLMVIIPSGQFKMGTLVGSGNPDETPIHNVDIERFSIGRYPVTVGEFKKFADFSIEGDDNYPIVNISWDDAKDYCAWLSEQTGQQYRLPSEAEWEYAARAGTRSDYWWGYSVGKNKLNSLDSGSEWSGVGTSPVGYFNPNPFGLYDIVGNVWEWCEDGYIDNYNYSSNIGKPTIESSTNLKVIRGGAWDYTARVFLRGKCVSFYALNSIGFRVVRELAQPIRSDNVIVSVLN